MEYGEIQEYKLNYGYEEVLKVGEYAFKGSDKNPIPYLVKRLVFEKGYGVRIVTNAWSDCGLFIAKSIAQWKKERVNYLNWIKESSLREIERIDKEIMILEQNKE